MRRRLAALLASLILAGLVLPVAGVAVSAAATPVAKVVIVVGPAGAATDRYRAEARDAAKLARKYTPDVTELYSPNATWPAVKHALQGASLVVYMGHGNGWPSKYRDSLYPPSQNGFGLNPEAGGGDGKHQYFGEGRIADAVRLADNAVVLLNHLCYASGNSEPGLAEGTLEQARQRVDNYAAGFIKAGAAAVIAEAYASPNHMIKTILGSSRSIESAWRNAPSRNGHAFAFASARSKGYVAQMDPERGTSGFSRSIVLKAGLSTADVRADARGSAAAAPVIDAISLAPSLVAAGIDITDPTFAGATAAASTLKYTFKYKVADRKALPKSMKASVRWDPLDPVAPDPANEVPPADTESAPAAEATAEPSATPSAEPSATPAASTEPAASADPAAPTEASAPASAETTAEASPEASPAVEPVEPPAEPEPPDLGLVAVERVGDVVDPVKVKIGKKSMSFKVAAPETPGRYRLTVTLHDGDGVAFDAGTQALLPALIVRVTGDLDAQVVAPSHTELAPASTSTVDLWVANLGAAAWGHGPIRDTKDPEGSAPATRARVVGQWVALGAEPGAIAAAATVGTVEAKLPAGQEPGALVDASLDLVAPAVIGEYLLLLDVVTPEHGSLVASGVDPTIIRVSVTAKPAKTGMSPLDGAE